MKTGISKVKNIQSNGTFESKHGLLYKFKYEFEDGTILNANHKTENSPFALGDEAEYTIKGEKDGYNWGGVSKPKDQDFNGYSQKKTVSTASFALSYAKDLVVAGKVDPEDTLACADRFNNWLKQNS